MRGLESDSLKSVALSTDSRTVRLVFEQSGSPFHVHVPADNFVSMIPLLIKTSIAATEQKEIIAIKIVSVHADLSPDGELLLHLENTSGAVMTFELGTEPAFELFGQLEKALRNQSGSNQDH